MNILAIDTATEYLSLAVSTNQKIVTSINKVDNQHSHKIIFQIQSLCESAGLKVKDINLIAYNQGPGSFTGLRVGLSVALGMAYGLNIQLVPIPSFMLYAINYQARDVKAKQMIVGLDARLSQMYFAGINLSDFTYFIEPSLVSPKEIVIPENVLVSGSAFNLYKDLINKNYLNNYVVDIDYPSAQYLIKLAKSPQFKSIDPKNADLLYLRDKVALSLEEQKLIKRNDN